MAKAPKDAKQATKAKKPKKTKITVTRIDADGERHVVQYGEYSAASANQYGTLQLVSRYSGEGWSMLIIAPGHWVDCKVDNGH